jgi:hypothetical protein
VKPDVLKMGLAQSFPGIDPRIFVALAIVEEVSVTRAGVKADVRVLPFNEPETVMVGAPGANNGSGLYIPVTPGQIVIVAFPRGSSDEGGRIIGSSWDTGDPPPAAALDHPGDVALVAAAATAIRLVTTATGVIVIASGGATLLGAETATLGVARLGDTVQVTIPIGTFDIGGVPNPVPVIVTGTITSASAKVKTL